MLVAPLTRDLEHSPNHSFPTAGDGCSVQYPVELTGSRASWLVMVTRRAVSFLP